MGGIRLPAAPVRMADGGGVSAPVEVYSKMLSAPGERGNGGRELYEDRIVRGWGGGYCVWDELWTVGGWWLLPTGVQTRVGNEKHFSQNNWEKDTVSSRTSDNFVAKICTWVSVMWQKQLLYNCHI